MAQLVEAMALSAAAVIQIVLKQLQLTYQQVSAVLRGS
jgi:hypothetical protein